MQTLNQFLPTGYRRSHLTLDIQEINQTSYRPQKRPRDHSWEDQKIQAENYGVCLKKGKFREHMEDKHSIREAV